MMLHSDFDLIYDVKTQEEFDALYIRTVKASRKATIQVSHLRAMAKEHKLKLPEVPD